MHVISKSAWTEVVAADPAVESSVSAWYKIARAAHWRNIVDVKQAYPHADFVDPYTVFNLHGNNYRLIVKIEYKYQLIFVKGLLTHREYDRGDWK